MLMISTIIISCSNDDSPQINPELNKTWEMKSYIAHIIELPEINSGDILWTIDVPNKKLTIINNIEEQYLYIRHSGIYDIEINHNTIKISGITYDYSIENGELIVSNNPELDGPIMTFIPK